MLYPELRRRLAEFAGDPLRPSARPQDVYFEQYDDGTGRPWVEGWEIRVSDERYELGFRERGRFTLRETFDSEGECCDWLFRELTRPHPVTPVPDEELAADIDRMQRRIAAERAERAGRRGKESDDDR